MTLAGFVIPQSVGSLEIQGQIKAYSGMCSTHCGSHWDSCLGRKHPELDRLHARSYNRYHLKHQESC